MNPQTEPPWLKLCTICSPSCSQAIGEPITPEPVLHCQSTAPVVPSSAYRGCAGTDAIGMVRAELGPDIPAAVIVADRMPEVRREVEALAVLNKPVHPAQLRTLLAKSPTAQWRC